jgi:hypothetical protein
MAASLLSFLTSLTVWSGGSIAPVTLGARSTLAKDGQHWTAAYLGVSLNKPPTSNALTPLLLPPSEPLVRL